MSVSFQKSQSTKFHSKDFDAVVSTEDDEVRARRVTAHSPYGDRSLRFSKRASVVSDVDQLELRRRSSYSNVRRQSIFSIGGEAQLNGRDIFKKYDIKPANKIFRWNLVWLFLVFLSPYPLWATTINCKLSYEITIVVNVIIAINYLFTTVLCWRYMWRMIRSFNTPYWQELDPTLREKVQHIVVMPTYKEPIELLLETISSVANQTVASSIVMVVGMEEKTPDQDDKKRKITERFGDSFKALIFSVHPTGVPGEITGACSNRNHAAREAVKFMVEHSLIPVDGISGEIDVDFTTVTVCDSDTTFFFRYFENLTWLFLNESPDSRYRVCWQSPLFYNISLDKRWFFTRVMGILRSYFMVGFLIGASINTMSIYSMSLRLLIESKFFHPGYQMDDIIYTLSAMKATGVRIKIRTIDIPTLSGPTSGVNLMDEWKEWVVQSTRWTIGAAEVFHYFFVKLIKRNYFLPGLAYFWWFVYYYGFILCSAGMIQMSNLVIKLISIKYESISIDTCKPMQNWFDLSDDFQYSWILDFFLIYFYVVVVGTAFCMDALIVQILALNEEISIVRNLCHYISALPVLWAYNLVEVKAIIEIAIYGKKVCGHTASEKHALAGLKSGNASENISTKLQPVEENEEVLPEQP